MAAKESQFIEFKESWRDEYLKVIAAFANSEGGELILGVGDRGKPVGLKDARRLLEDLPNKIRNKLGIIPSLEIKEINKTEIVKLTVSRCSVPISYDGKFYVRSGSTVQELTGIELADFLMKKSGYTWDEVVEERAAFDELNKGAIEQFQKYAIERIPSIVKESDIETLLQKLKLVDGRNLKRAALLLFGNAPQRFYLQSIVKIVNSEYQKLFNVSKRTSTYDLDELVQKNLLQKTGKRGRGIFYQIKRGNNGAKRA